MSTTPSPELAKAALRWFGQTVDHLSDAQRRVLHRTLVRKPLDSGARRGTGGDDSTFGAHLADRVARFGGSWTFILFFGAVLLVWTGANAWLLTRPFDPYPFIFLNLLLSMLAALQAPVIMMSQNRQAARDRIEAGHDCEVNLKAEIEIMALHEKLDQMRDEQIHLLLAEQQRQIALLTALLERHVGIDPAR